MLLKLQSQIRRTSAALRYQFLLNAALIRHGVCYIKIKYFWRIKFYFINLRIV